MKSLFVTLACVALIASAAALPAERSQSSEEDEYYSDSDETTTASRNFTTTSAGSSALNSTLSSNSTGTAQHVEGLEASEGNESDSTSDDDYDDILENDEDAESESEEDTTAVADISSTIATGSLGVNSTSNISVPGKPEDLDEIKDRPPYVSSNSSSSAGSNPSSADNSATNEVTQSGSAAINTNSSDVDSTVSSNSTSSDPSNIGEASGSGSINMVNATSDAAQPDDTTNKVAQVDENDCPIFVDEDPVDQECVKEEKQRCKALYGSCLREIRTKCTTQSTRTGCLRDGAKNCRRQRKSCERRASERCW